jgi:Ca2+-binding RTX toxin-like protein
MPRPHSAPTIESLESRLLMAVTVSVSSKGKLNIIAPPGDTAGDLVEVTLLNGKSHVQVFVNGVVVDPNPNRGEVDSVKKKNIERIVADMGGGDDRVFVGSRADTPRPFKNQLSLRATLVGGDGNDTLQGGPQNDLIIGGAGDDILFGDKRQDLVFGGTGNDQIFGEGGRDNLFGQDGDDGMDGGGQQDHLYGMSGADNLVGGVDDDFVNPAPGPGDTRDHNDRPHAGETRNVFAYVDKLIKLAVPDKYRAAAKS